MAFDPTNIKLNQMRKGYFVDYNFKTWRVEAWYEYDWGNDYFTDEYKLTAIGERESIFLHVEEKDTGLECTITQPINIHQIEENVVDYIKLNETPPTRLTFKGKTYYKHGEGVGYFRNTDTDKWEELISWTYYDDSKKELLNIEQWGPEDFEAHIGIVVDEYSFSNILASTEEIDNKGSNMYALSNGESSSSTKSIGKYVFYAVLAIVGIWLLVWLFSPSKTKTYDNRPTTYNSYSSGSSSPSSQTTRASYANSPVDNLIEQHKNYPTFSIILEDMRENNGNFEHKYKVITNVTDPNLRKETITPWMTVSPEFFQRNLDNQYMELASKGEDGKINKVPAPPGYANYVGNEKYGQWRQDPVTGDSFWEFYGKYAFMSNMFNLMAAPVYRTHYYDYRNNYYGQQPYYGVRTPTGAYQYGTTGAIAQKTLPPTVFEQRRAAMESFREKVRSRVEQSAPRTPTNPNTRPAGSTSTRKSIDRSSPSTSSSYSTSPSSGRSFSSGTGNYSSPPSRTSRYSSGSSSYSSSSSSSSSSSYRSRGGRSGK